jgi:hypothetical protein
VRQAFFFFSFSRCVNQPGAGLINKVAQLLGGRTHAPDTAGDSQATLFPPKPAFEDPGHFCEQQTLASTIKDRSVEKLMIAF